MSIEFNTNVPTFSGWVYVISIQGNGMPVICKIGGTKRDPETRYRELVNQELVEDDGPLQLDLFDKPILQAGIYVENGLWQVEHGTHQILADQYINHGSELFRVTPEEAVMAIMSAMSAYHLMVA